MRRVLLAGYAAPACSVYGQRINYPNGGGNDTIRIQARGATVDEFVDPFPFFGGKPFVNRTGIKGRYDFQLEFPGADPVKSAIAALNDRFGIKVEPAIVPQDVLVIDSIQRPN